jgi:hypothetical protein
VTDSGAITAVARAVWFAIRDKESGQLMFLSGKNNLGKDVPGLSYSIEEVKIEGGILAPRIAWEETTTTTAEQALSVRNTRATDGEAEEWLGEYLREHGPMEANKTIKAARDDLSISPYALRKAAHNLGVEQSKTGFQGKTIWTLTDDFDFG